MIPLPEALASHLAGTTTTTCYCWRLTRRDGAVFGFSDHDAMLEFDGVAFSPQTGFTAGEAEAVFGLEIS